MLQFVIWKYHQFLQFSGLADNQVAEKLSCYCMYHNHVFYLLHIWLRRQQLW